MSEGAIDLTNEAEPQLTLPGVEDAPENEIPGDVPQEEKATQSEAKESAEPKPVTFEPFNLPEGVEVAEEDLNVFTELASKYGLDQEGAQSLVDLGLQIQTTALQQAQAQADQESEATRAEWQAQLRSDQELGGKNLPETQKNVTAFEKTGLASPELISILKETGLVYHPEFVRMMNAIGKMSQENPVSIGGVGGAEPVDPVTKMFANSGHI